MAENWEKLNAAKEARKLSKEVISITAQFPNEEKYHLTAQIKSSSSSVFANIAEGHGRYFY